MDCISINYKKVPLDIRETYAFSTEQQTEFAAFLKETYGIGCVVVLSTCNRSELYFCSDGGRSEQIENALAAYKNIPREDILNHIYSYQGDRALRHLFFVASGLDSMVLGEDEILHQIKESYGQALSEGRSCNEMNIAFQGALCCAKSIKTETLLSKTPVSTGTLAANTIEEFLQKDHTKKILIVGITGKIGSILAKNLYSKNIRNITGTSRKHVSVSERGGLDGLVMTDFAERYEILDEMDVIVSASTSPHYTFTAEKVKEVLKTRKPRMFLDMAVPRDMDRAIAGISDCRLVDMDDFARMAESNHGIKQKEVLKAQMLLEEKLDETIKDVAMSSFMEQKRELFEQIKKREFGSVFYQMKEHLSSDNFKALVEAVEQL